MPGGSTVAYPTTMLGGIGATVLSILAIVALLALARVLTNWITDWWE